MKDFDYAVKLWSWKVFVVIWVPRVMQISEVRDCFGYVVDLWLDMIALLKLW